MKSAACPFSMQRPAMAAARCVLPQPLGPTNTSQPGGCSAKASAGLDGGGEALLVLRVRAAAARAQVLEREAGERAEVAVAQQAGALVVLLARLRAVAGEGAAEVRVAQAHGLAHEAGALAARAGVVVRRRSASGPGRLSFAC